MDDDNQDDPQRDKRYGTIPQWLDASGMGRTSTYQEIGNGNIKAVKQRNRTLIDFESGWRYLKSLPRAEVRRKPPRASRKRPNGRPQENRPASQS